MAKPIVETKVGGKRKLPPYQYVLRFPSPIPEPVKQRAHLIFHNGRWKLFHNKWKAQFVGPKYHAACISGNTIPDLINNLHKAHDKWRYACP